MRHIFTVSIDTELENELDEYQKKMSFQTRSEGAIQLLRKGLRYDSDIEQLKKEILKLQDEIKGLKNKPSEIHLPCTVCGKPISIFESLSDPIYVDMKKQYKDWGHSSCVDSQKKK